MYRRARFALQSLLYTMNSAIGIFLILVVAAVYSIGVLKDISSQSVQDPIGFEISNDERIHYSDSRQLSSLPTDEDDSYILRRKLQELSNALAEKDSKIQELKGKIRVCEEAKSVSGSVTPRKMMDHPSEFGENPLATQLHSRGFMYGMHHDRESLDEVSVVVICPSVGIEEGGRQRRDYVRKFWADSMKRVDPWNRDKVVLKFIVGDGWSRTNRFFFDDSPGKELKEELESFDDILMFEIDDKDDWPQSETLEGQSSTTMKVLKGMDWATRNYKFKYLVRIGDDAYFRIDYFLNTIMPTLPTSRLLMGRICPDVDIGSDLWRLNNLFFNQTDRMTRDPKNARNQMVAFPYGAGWAVSSDIAELLGALERSNSPIRRHAPEDWVMGSLMFGLSIDIRNDIRWHDAPYSTHPFAVSQGMVQSCKPDSILVHHIDWAKLSVDSSGNMHGC